MTTVRGISRPTRWPSPGTQVEADSGEAECQTSRMEASSPGELIATGRTSDVYAYGADAVVKVPRPGVPAHWAAAEAAFSEAIEPLGLPAPRVRDLVAVEGRPSIVFDRVVGPSMWDEMRAAPASKISCTEGPPGMMSTLRGRSISATTLAI